MRNFISLVSENYRPNPYHSFVHGFSVFHVNFLMISNLSLKSKIEILQLYAVAIAALCHDVGHPGVNNQYLINLRDKLAIRYNDKSVLENMHAALTFTLAEKKECNIIGNIALEDYKIFRKTIITW